MPRYTVHLEQHEWVNTENFEFEAESEAEAMQKAQEFVDEHKDLGEHRLSAELIPEPEEEEPEAGFDGEQRDTTNVPEGEVVE